MTKARPLCPWVIVPALLTLSCRTVPGSNPLLPANATDVLFDWFEYRGEQPGSPVALSGEDFENPILAGFYPDPSIVRVNDAFYLVNSSFAYFPGIPIFKSRDLVNWMQIGSVLDRPTQLDFGTIGISRGIFAPTIRYRDGLFYLITTAVDVGGNMILTATDPAGPWSDPTWLPDVDGIDPSIFFDDDGRAYVTNNGPPAYPPRYDGHRAIWIQEFDADHLRTHGPRTVLVDGGVDIEKHPIWIEGPHLFKVNGQYYLIAAEGGTGDQHSEVVFRSHSVTGPYEPFAGNPILTQRHLDPARPGPVTSTGHADLVETQDGDWWAVFLGCRPYDDDLYNTGRETFLMPVRWVDGWPIILTGDESVPTVLRRPDLPTQAEARVPHRGDFTIRDNFEGQELERYWNLIRAPAEPWYSLTDVDGYLRIRARPELLSGPGQPSFVGRRQQHMFATVTAAMRYRPSVATDRAGIAAFQNRDFYYLMTVSARDTGPVVELERRVRGRSEIVAEAPLGGTAPDGNILLRIEARGAEYRFLFSSGQTTELPSDLDDHWHVLADGMDGTVLSTRRAGGFVGAYFGLFAYSGSD